MVIGMTGDLLRGAIPIGLDTAIGFGPLALAEVLTRNPGVTSFRVYVNPYGRFIAQQVVKNANVNAEFRVLTDEGYAKDSWRIEPDSAVTEAG